MDGMTKRRSRWWGALAAHFGTAQSPAEGQRVPVAVAARSSVDDTAALDDNELEAVCGGLSRAWLEGPSSDTDPQHN